MRKTALNGNQFGFSSGDSGVASGPRSSTSAAGFSKASPVWVSAATAVCGLTCLTFDRVVFFVPARLVLALAAAFPTGLAFFFAAVPLRGLPIADDFRLRAAVRFVRCAMVAPVL
jgi:hypothetical protein